MEYTTNYQLTQWDESDRILRADFNRDNARTEAAILDRLGPVEVIQQVELSRDSTLSDAVIDLTDLDWDAWSFVAVEFLGSLSGPADYMLYMDFTGAPLTGYPGAAATLTPRPGLVVLLPCRDASRTVRLLSFPGGELGTSTSAYSALQTVHLAANYTGILSYLQGSASLTLYGIR